MKLKIMLIIGVLLISIQQSFAGELCWLHSVSADSYVVSLVGSGGFAGLDQQFVAPNIVTTNGVDKITNDAINIDSEISYKVAGVFAGVTGAAIPVTPGCNTPPVTIPVATTSICGDVSNDGIVTARDAMMVLQAAVGNVALTCN